MTDKADMLAMKLLSEIPQMDFQKLISEIPQDREIIKNEDMLDGDYDVKVVNINMHANEVNGTLSLKTLVLITSGLESGKCTNVFQNIISTTGVNQIGFQKAIKQIQRMDDEVVLNEVMDIYMSVKALKFMIDNGMEFQGMLRIKEGNTNLYINKK